MSYRLVLGADYINDGCDEDVVLNCAAGLSLLPNKLQATEAAHVVEQLGEKNLLKVPLVSLDCAAEGVGKLMFKKKSEIVEELRTNNADELADMTPMQQEVMDTATMSKCQRHIDQLYGGQIVKHETEVQVEQHIKWNMGRRIQCWLLSRVIWRGRGTKAARKKLVVRAVASYIRNKGRAWTELPALDYTYPMDREKISVKSGKAVYRYYLTDQPPNIWKGLCSMSNLCATKACPYSHPPSFFFIYLVTLLQLMCASSLYPRRESIPSAG